MYIFSPFSPQQYIIVCIEKYIKISIFCNLLLDRKMQIESFVTFSCPSKDISHHGHKSPLENGPAARTLRFQTENKIHNPDMNRVCKRWFYIYFYHGPWIIKIFYDNPRSVPITAPKKRFLSTTLLIRARTLRKCLHQGPWPWKRAWEKGTPAFFCVIMPFISVELVFLP